MNHRDWHDPVWAATWDRENVMAQPVRKEHLELLLALIDRFGLRSLIDLGCGGGLVAELVLDRIEGSSIVGIDSSSAQLEIARERLARFGGRARLVPGDLGDVAALGEGFDPVDGALAVQALHHLEPGRLDALLAWVRSMMRPGGWLLIADRVAIPSAGVYEAFQEHKGRLGLQRNADRWEEYAADLAGSRDRPVTLDDYLRRLGRAGFEAGSLDCRADRVFLVARA